MTRSTLQNPPIQLVIPARAECYITFYICNLPMFIISKFFSGKALQPSLMFVCEAMSLPQSGAPETEN